MSEEERVEVGDVAKRVVNSRAGVKQLLVLLEEGGENEDKVEALIQKLEGGADAVEGVEGMGTVVPSEPKDDEQMSVASSRWSTENHAQDNQGARAQAVLQQQREIRQQQGLQQAASRRMMSDTASITSTIPEEREIEMDDIMNQMGLDDDDGGDDDSVDLT